MLVEAIQDLECDLQHRSSVDAGYCCPKDSKSNALDPRNSPLNAAQVDLTNVCGRTVNNEPILRVEIKKDDNPPGTWPWMGSLGYRGVGSAWVHQCGVSLISHKFALTAAHCGDDGVFQPGRTRLRFGDDNLAEDFDDGGVHETEAKSFVMHPRYRAAYFDIALVELADPVVVFTDYVRPVCLPERAEPIDANKGIHVRLMGWGNLKLNEGTTSKVLRSTSLMVFPQQYCNLTHRIEGSSPFAGKVRKSLPQLFQSNVFCVGDENGKRGPCRGDSGGPIVRFDFDGKTSVRRYVQLGVVHGAVGSCASDEFPGIYGRLKDADVLRWIKKTSFNEDLDGVTLST